MTIWIVAQYTTFNTKYQKFLPQWKYLNLEWWDDRRSLQLGQINEVTLFWLATRIIQTYRSEFWDNFKPIKALGDSSFVLFLEQQYQIYFIYDIICEIAGWYANYFKISYFLG